MWHDIWNRQDKDGGSGFFLRGKHWLFVYFTARNLTILLPGHLAILLI